jgi:hypothetical protein
MFRQLARWNQLEAGGGAPVSPALAVLAYHPAQMQRYLEERWAARPAPGQMPALGVPLPLLPQEQTSGLELGRISVEDIYPIGAGGLQVPWPHLIYAFMVEQTRIVDVFRRIAIEALHGEHLGTLTAESQAWLRNLEMLHFSDFPPGHIARVTSRLRPDPGAVRRNAYWRMFGLELLHEPEDSQVAYLKAKAANREFVRALEDFLREVWRGIENYTNTSGPNSTDPATIANLAQLLQETLTVRRAGGTLSREEFMAVAQLDFLHLTIEYDSPIVEDLAGEATSADERLRKCGERVGIATNPKSEAYLELADDLSVLLLAIEAGQHSTAALATSLYATGAIRDRMMNIITQWSAVTGRDMKARKVTVTSRGPEPRPPARPRAPASTGNGATASEVVV